MTRFGVLADLSVKAARPEYFPLDLGTMADRHPVSLHKHPFKGIKHKVKRGLTPRYAMNDLNNFAIFTAPQLKEEAKFNAVMQYRKNLGSTNYIQNLENAYKQRITAGATKPNYQSPTKQQVDMNTQTGGTLQMFGMSKFEGASLFDRKFPEYSELFSKRMKATFANIVEQEDLGGLLSQIFPTGRIAKQKHKDEDVLEKLNIAYRDEPEQIGIIQRAYDTSAGEAGKQMFPEMELSSEPREPETEE